MSRQYTHFYFFPFYHTGGAEKVHAQIALATGGPHAIIFFTKKSVDQNFYATFQQSGCTLADISRFTDNKRLYFINLVFRGIVSGYINRQPKPPIIFNGQCNFGYKISPWINKSVPQAELIHSFNTFSWIRLPFLPFISATVMISRIRIKDHLAQYQQLGIPEKYNNKINYIVNGIPLPLNVTEKNAQEPLCILYAGRGTPEKRVHIIAAIAQKASLAKLPVRFEFMGDVSEAIPSELLPFCTLLGHQSDEKKIQEFYQKAHVVIITSNTEGFPLVIEEGMANGCIIMATAVGDIPVHVQPQENGLLFSEVENEQVIIEEAVNYLTLLTENKTLIKTIGSTNRKYAELHFGLSAFTKAYQQFFSNLSPRL